MSVTDLYRQNDLRLAALAGISSADIKKHNLGPLLEVEDVVGAGDAGENAVFYVLDFSYTHGFKPAVLGLEGIKKLPALGGRFTSAFGTIGDVNVVGLREFLASDHLKRFQLLDFHSVTLDRVAPAFAKADFSQARVLVLDSSKLRPSTVLANRSLSQLRHLNLSRVGATSADLAALIKSPTLAKLTTLDLTMGGFEGDLQDVVKAEELGRLEALMLGWNDRPAWDVLATSLHLRRLRTLDIWPHGFEDGGSQITRANFPALENLSIGPWSSFARSAELPPLSRLALLVSSVEELEAFAKSPLLDRLQHLELKIDADQQRTILPHLPLLYDRPGFRKLRGLSLPIDWTQLPAEAEMVCRLPAMEGLKSFCVGLAMTPPLIELLLAHGALRGVEHLALSSLETPESMRLLAESPQLSELESLSLTIGAIGDEGVMALAQSPHIKKLQRLDLGGVAFGGKGLRALAESDNFSRLVELRAHGARGVTGKPKQAFVEHEKMPRLWLLEGFGGRGQPELRTIP